MSWYGLSLVWSGYGSGARQFECCNVFVTRNTFVKLASYSVKTVTSWQMLLVRYHHFISLKNIGSHPECCRNIVVLLLSAPIMLVTKVPITGPGDNKLRLKLGLQAFFSNILVLCYLEAMIRLPMGDFGAIAFSSPVFTMIMSVFMLKVIDLTESMKIITT